MEAANKAVNVDSQKTSWQGDPVVSQAPPPSSKADE